MRLFICKFCLFLVYATILSTILPLVHCAALWPRVSRALRVSLQLEHFQAVESASQRKLTAQAAYAHAVGALVLARVSVAFSVKTTP